MKRLIIFMFGMGVFLFGNVTDKYLEYTNKIVYYGFELKNFDKIKPPFREYSKHVFSRKMVENNNNVVLKSINIQLLSVLNNEAYFLVKEYLGSQLVKSYKKWVHIDNNIAGCKVVKIKNTEVLLKCKDKNLVKTLNKKIPAIKEIK